MLVKDFNKLKGGEWIAGISAVLLFAFMFLDWFGVEIAGERGSINFGSGAGGSAWDALDLIPIILVVTVVIVLASIVLKLSDFSYSPPVLPSIAVTALGGISTLLILYRIIDPPDLGSFGTVSVNATPELGIFLGLIAAAGIACGGYLAVREETRSP
jgi:hypothetical protein